MKKRVLSLFMAFVLCLTLLPAPALAVTDKADVQNAKTEGVAQQSAGDDLNDAYAGRPDTNVAVIGDTAYKSLSEALDEATDDATVTLVANVTEAVAFGADKSVTLNMNGKTLTAAAAENGSPALTVSNGTLTVTGAATIKAGEQPVSAISVTGGNLTFTGGLTATGGASNDKVASAIEVSGGTVTFQGEVNATAQDINTTGDYTLAPAIKVSGDSTVTFCGTVTATGGYNSRGGNAGERKPAIYAEGGTLDFKGDQNPGELTLDGGLTLTQSAKLKSLLTQGTFSVKAGTGASPLSVEEASFYTKVSDLLAENRVCVKTDSLAEGQEKVYVNTGARICSDNVTIVEHTHTWPQDEITSNSHSCVCGRSESHEYGSDGKCSACGYECQHKDVDNDGTCFTCKVKMAVESKASDGTKTYTTDFTAAMNAAQDGTTLTLLSDVTRGTAYADKACITGDGVTVTLKLNGHTINGGWILVGVDGNGNNYTSSTLNITGSGSFITSGNLSVGYSATLDLSGWGGGEKDLISEVSLCKNGNIVPNPESLLIVGENIGTIGSLGFNSWPSTGVKTKLNGGSYGSVSLSGVDEQYGSLLAKGYAFQYMDSGEYVEYTAPTKWNPISNVKVVKCPHNGLTVDQETHEGTCAYCGTSGKFVAAVDGDTYDNWDAAFKKWLKDGGTLKLYTDYIVSGDVTWNGSYGPYILDLNGHTMSAGSGAFKPSDELVAGMSLTIQDTSEDKNGSISNIVLNSANNYQSLTLESGHIDNLEAIDYSGGLSIRGGSVGNLDVKTWSDGPILSITGGSIDDLKIQEWPKGKIVSIEGGSIGKYSLPKGRVLADAIEHQYYAEGTSLERSEDDANGGKFVIKQAPTDFGPDIKTADAFYGGDVPIRFGAVDSETAGYWEPQWYVRTDSGAVPMTENKVTGANAGETLNVFCVITGKDGPNGSTKWQVALMGRTLTVVPAKLSDATITIENADTLVYSGQPLTPEVKVAYNGKELTKGTDYTISGKTSGIDAGEYTLRIEAMGSNYTGEKDKAWKIAPHKLSSPVTDTSITKVYDGTITLPDGIITSVFASRVNLGSTVTLKPGTDYTVLKKNYTDPNVGQEKEIYYKIKLLNPNYSFLNGGDEMDFYETALFAITKATMESDTMTADKAFTIVNKLSKTYEIELAQYLPTLPDGCEYGEVTYSDLSIDLRSQYYSGGAPGAPVAEIKDGKVLLPILPNGETTTGKVGTVQVMVSSANYENFLLYIDVNAINKIEPTGQPTLSKDTLIYGEKLGSITLSGAMKNGDAVVEGTFAWTAPETVPDAGTYQAAWRFTPADSSTYDEVAGTVTVTIEKATLTGAPEYTLITARGKTLADAALAVNESWPDGTVQWVDKDGNALPDDTVVEANMTYKWKFTPADTNNYNTLEGSVKLYSVSTGGGGGTVTPPTTTETETTTDPDGTTTKTETKSDGSTVETVTKPDGSTTTTETKTETKPDGSTTTTETKSEANADGSKTETKSETTTAADGSKTETKSETKVEADGTKSETKAETKTDANGVTSGTETTQTTTPDGSTGTTTTTTENGNSKTEAEAKISEKAVEDAKQSGEAVKVPTEVRAGEDSNSAPTVKVELPENAGETKIEIPVSDVNSGTVAVIVHEDGTEEIVKSSTTTENGLQLKVDGSATIKVIDNSKDFRDTRDHWSRDEVNFVASRELFNGVGGSSFGVNEPMTRGMVNTVLARLAGVDTTTSGGSKWYEAGTAWAKDNGISDGTNPTANVTREQLAAMLYRFAGSPEVSGELSFADADQISGYAKNALLWAVQNGILNGVGDNRVAPKNSAERAQVAAMMARYLKNL